MPSIFARSRLPVSMLLLLASACASEDGASTAALSIAPLGGDAAPDAAETGQSADGASGAAPPPSAVGAPSDAAIAGQADPQDVEKLAAGNRAFAFELFRAVGAGHPGENVTLAPYAASSALAMVFAGARRRTEAELGATLHFDVPQPALHAAFAEVTRTLAGRAAGDGTLALRFGSGAWVRSDLPIEPAYAELLTARYGGAPEPADFAGDPAGARAAINARIAERTGAQIRDLLQPSDVSAQTQLLLTSAASLAARWQVPFDSARTAPATFTSADGAQVQVPTMQVHGTFARARGDDWEAVALPLAGDALELLAVLPDAGAYAQVEGQVSASWLDALRGALKPEPLAVALPKLSLRGRTSLRPALEALDLRTLFRGADLTGISADGVVVADVIQETTIEVTEEGASAASDAGTGGGDPFAGASVRFDRPFLYAIVDRPTGQILFVGRMLRKG